MTNSDSENDDPSREMRRLDLTRSHQYSADAAQIIAGGVNSNVRLGPESLCFEKAHDATLIDVDGNEYVDYALGMGPMILGHAPQAVIHAVTQSLSRGQLFAGQHSLELSLAQLLHQHVPTAELVRIGLTGSEMVQAALRLARAHTGRTHFVKFEGHYHGWFDNVLVNHTNPANDPTGALPFPIYRHSAGQSIVATSETYVLPWNNISAVSRFLEQRGDEIAAVITEPVMCNTGVISPQPGYLEALRELCDKHGVILIFDEVITGFRLGLSGAQGYFDVNPDLSVFAKAFGGGFPVAALAGRADIMQMVATGEVNHSGTYNAHLVSLSAAIATLEALAADEGAAYRWIDEAGTKLMSGIRDIAKRRGVNLQVHGYPAVFHTCFSDDAEDEIIDCASWQRTDTERLSTFTQALLEAGVRPTSRGTWFVSSAHTVKDIDSTLVAVDKVLEAGI